jgi:hypothetical protein
MATKAYTNKGMVLLTACAAQFIVVLDIAIVNVALPMLRRISGVIPLRKSRWRGGSGVFFSGLIV